MFLSRINPFKDPLRAPRIIETLFRSADIKSFQRINETRELLDTLIVPDVKDFALLDFKSYPEISDIGYEEAMRVIAASQSLAEVECHSDTVSDNGQEEKEVTQSLPQPAAQGSNNELSDDGTEEPKAI